MENGKGAMTSLLFFHYLLSISVPGYGCSWVGYTITASFCLYRGSVVYVFFWSRDISL